MLKYKDIWQEREQEFVDQTQINISITATCDLCSCYETVNDHYVNRKCNPVAITFLTKGLRLQQCTNFTV